ncbi:light-regulated histidine kinase 1 [Rhodopirellula baltica SH 1]|uniref:histidine kinase n=1 Tax=Rhodopirellula baltica (strain DSM 10527 / NCIMB 13988 / SH1) TaxID=243090 RepID=Q7UEQ2_RHOBA|nr:light-regulated histidine kinase 1 [Rhodopirellula baltica SH 1]
MRTSTLILCIGLCIAAVTVISWYMISADQRRQVVNENAARAIDTTERLEREIGYGGLIHHFKNYVLRPTESQYYEDAIQNAETALQLILELEQIDQGPIQGKPLPETRRMIAEYSRQLQIVHEMASENASAREIDAAVRFDDTPTLNELKTTVDSLGDAYRTEAGRLERLTRALMILNVILGLGTAITLATFNVRQHIKNLRNQVVYIELLGQSGGIWNWNRQTDEVQYAPKFRELLGYAGDDTESFPENVSASRDRIHAEDIAIFADRLANQKQTRKPFSVEFRMLDHEDCYRWFRTHAHTLFDNSGTPIRTAGTIFNIEDSKKYEHELQESNQELQRFAFAASHDLQEPLRAITGFSQLLQQRHTNSLDEKGQGYLRHIVEGAGRMKTLIDDILTLSRVGQSELEFAEINLDDCVQMALQNLSQLIRETEPEIRIGKLGIVHGHEGFLVELFQNLISNAIKFRKPDQTAKIDIDSHTKDSRINITVADQGIGISKTHHAQVFELFKRLHRREQIPGTGIGLALCKRIVERHHGTISLISEEGEGSTFRVSLPADTQTDPSAQEIQHVKPSETHRHPAGRR